MTDRCTPFEVVGDSMWPVLKHGDVVFTRESSQVRAGELVVRQLGDSHVVHRFLAPGETKGDAAPRIDDGSGFSSAGRVVVGVVPRKLSTKHGDARIAPASSRFALLQTRLSSLQAGSQSRLTRVAARALLVLNGLLIRSSYYSRKQETLDVVHDHH